MPGRGIQHVDLAVSDVGRSLAFYTELLGPLGLEEEERYPTYRGTEEVVYYAFFVFDPDGLRIEGFSPGPQWSARIHRQRDE
jgi:catechol 2,3-dioxygenase-like lactoylglutathione lyase family enzyme